MIFDKLSNLHKFLPLNIKHKVKILPDDLLTSKILSDNFYVKKIEYHTKDIKDCRIESHNVYVDIQVVLSGEEFIYVYDSKKLLAMGSYDKSEDIQFYHSNISPDAIIKLQPGYFCIFFIEDAHMAAVKTNNQVLVEKIVVKVNNELFPEEK